MAIVCTPEVDLQKLERIIALKSFGFGLKQIKVLVNNDQGEAVSLKDQQKCLEGQIAHLNQANDAITKILADRKAGTIEWQRIAQLIEVFHMTKKLQDTWAGQEYPPEQLKQLAEALKGYSEAEMAEYHERWRKLIDKVQQDIHEDPAGPIGKAAKEWMD